MSCRTRLPAPVPGTGQRPCILTYSLILGLVPALWTAAHYSIPVLILISNNRSNFNDEIHQETVAKMRDRAPENRWIGQRIDDPEVDIAEYAAALGVQSAGPVTKVGELVPAIEAALKVVEAGGPFVLNVHVQKGYAVPPPAREA